MSTKRILIVDDEQDLCEILNFNLTSAGFETAVAYSAEDAIRLMGDTRFNLLILDVMMPGMSGFELGQWVRQHSATTGVPIIYLTARDSTDDVLTGFDIGADDYVTKPFSVREIIARVKAVLGRISHEDEVQPPIGIIINTNHKSVSIDGNEISLTPNEYDLLHFFLEHQGEVFSRQQLIENVWPSDVVVSDRTVDVNITRLRKKLGRYAANLVSRVGFGYYFKN